MSIVTMLIIINAIDFAVFGIDKQAAKLGTRRVSERTLWISAAAFGALGSTLGMLAFRHKTRHKSFRVGLPCLLAAQAIILPLIWRYINI
jgi:uncharacterized membrane protein YsdA (DUF1294 family)